MDANVLNFCNSLEGTYDNWQQASSNPRLFSHVMLKWERLGENELKIKQWYVHEGEIKPYRERWHKVLTDPETNGILVENWSENWEYHNSCCDMIFEKNEEFYQGKIKGNNCIVKNALVKSFVSFDGKIYQSMDQGWIGDTLSWGSSEIYKFHKIK